VKAFHTRDFPPAEGPGGVTSSGSVISTWKTQNSSNKRSLAVALISLARASCIRVQTIWNSLADDDRKAAERLNAFRSKPKTKLLCIALSRYVRAVVEHWLLTHVTLNRSWPSTHHHRILNNGILGNSNCYCLWPISTDSERAVFVTQMTEFRVCCSILLLTSAASTTQNVRYDDSLCINTMVFSAT